MNKDLLSFNPKFFYMCSIMRKTLQEHVEKPKNIIFIGEGL